MKKFFTVFAVTAILFILAACGGENNQETPPEMEFPTENIAPIEPEATPEATPEPTPAPEELPAISVGQAYEFGGYTWRVLDIYQDYALIITQEIIMLRAYHNTHEPVTWETSDMREFLNTEFYAGFSEEERARIRETEVINVDNRWYGTPGGNDTTDKIFLLSLEETVMYFGDSGALQNRPNLTLSDVGRTGYYYEYTDDHDWLATDPLIWWIYDRFNNARRVRNAETNEWEWWWLRSPGWDSYSAANVYPYGFIMVSGAFITADWAYGGVRPAMWVSLDEK